MTANLTSEYYSTSRDEDGEYDSAFAKLAAAGVGSENFSSTSLNRNREIGLVISNSAIMSAIARSFAADFATGKHWT